MAAADSAGSFDAEFPAALDSVVAARRQFAAAARSWGLPSGLADDATLAVSELVTNAVLHARTVCRVTLRRLGPGVRIEVRDGDTHLPIVGASRPEDLLANRSMTGRGLALVATLADRWGADPEPGGKVTWAELGTGTRLVSSAPEPSFPPTPDAPVISPSAQAAGVTAVSAVTGGGCRVHLIGVPVQLLVESTRQLADLQREMQVAALDRSGPDELADVVEAVGPLQAVIDEWAQIDRAHAEAALARGQERLDWEVTVTADIAEGLERLALWFRRSASSIVRRHLLSVPPSDQVAAYRSWYRDEILSQLSGQPPQLCPLEVPEGR